MKQMNRRLEDIWENVVALVINDDNYDEKSSELHYIKTLMERLNEDIDCLIH